MYDIRLIALDLDGTLFDDQKQISPRTLAALRAALDRGVAVIPATGRTLDGVPPEFLNLPGVRYVLTSNGASVIDRQTGQRLVEQPFDPGQALALCEILEPHGGMISIFIDGTSYSSEAVAARCLDLVPAALRPYFRKTRQIVPDMRPILREHAAHIEKFSILYRSLAERDAAWQAVAAAYPLVEVTTSLERNLELNAPGVSKGTGLLALADVLGLRPDQVMACGDSCNDLTMVRLAGLGVAMGNATPEVLAAADYVTDDNNHDGVAAAIERFVLSI